MNIELLQTVTEDDLILSGIYSEGDKSKPIVILIHGFMTDFYTHKFIHSIQENLSKIDVGCASIQNRGTGLHSEFLTSDRKDSKWIGSYYERLEESHLDISAWVSKLKELGYSKFILAGHSLGTIKSVRYVFEGKFKEDIEKLILLAPFDKNAFIENFTKGKWKEYVEIAKSEIEKGNSENIIPDYFDEVPMSYQNYYSWYQLTELNQIWDFYKGNKYAGQLLKQIKIPVQVIVGDKDKYFYIPEFGTLEDAHDILVENFSDIEVNILKGAEHTYVGFEDAVAELVSEFVL